MHGYLVNKTGREEAGMAMTTEADFPAILIKESLQKEKQIVVDPVSLKESSFRQACFETTLPAVLKASEATILHPPPLLPPKPKFLSLSLPNSANSSPKKPKGKSPEWPCQAGKLTSKHQHVLQENHLGRSKSCGEGRACAPSDEFDLCLTKPSAREDDSERHHHRRHDSFWVTEAIKGSPNYKSGKQEEARDKAFNCSALCLYLPAFGKPKRVKPRSNKELEMGGVAVISRTVSLERFECGSWASSAIINENEGDSMSSYFDLPSELIKCSAHDTHSPVTAAFVFHTDHKGVVKNGFTKSGGRKSDASPGHVGFSSAPTSYPASPSPTFCFTPRLLKAREEFNAFLEAQSA